MKLRIAFLALIISLALGTSPSFSAITLDPLSKEDIAIAQAIVTKLSLYIQERKLKGDVNLLTYDDVYSGLEVSEKNFLDEIRNIKPVPENKKQLAEIQSKMIPIDNQTILMNKPDNPKKHMPYVIERQFLPQNVYQAYVNMMSAMEKDLGRRLFIESGYRSPAYQLYLFVFYLSNHNYSVKETNRWVALPGTSEHGAPEHQAIDFINVLGVSGENHPEDFEKLPEYEWLTQNANQFGFVLSYPKNNSTNSAFEPWHWRYETK